MVRRLIVDTSALVMSHRGHGTLADVIEAEEDLAVGWR